MSIATPKPLTTPSTSAQWKLVPVEPTQAMNNAGSYCQLSENGLADEIYAAMIAASPSPASSPAGGDVELGWLIELKGATPSWAILNPRDYDEHWTTDSARAIRFAREGDAQAYIDHIGWTEAFPSEHIWDDGRAALSSSAGPAVEAVAWRWRFLDDKPSAPWSYTTKIEDVMGIDIQSQPLYAHPAPATVQIVKVLEHVGRSHPQYCETMFRAAEILAALAPATEGRKG